MIDPSRVGVTGPLKRYVPADYRLLIDMLKYATVTTSSSSGP
jgi:hypothetical protein